jgi:hypothetical protein
MSILTVYSLAIERGFVGKIKGCALAGNIRYAIPFLDVTGTD